VIRASVVLRIAAALAVAGCAAAAPSLDDDPAAVARRIAARARDAQIVYLGESHDNPHHHADQARVLEAMLAGGARPALAFEMLDQDQQPALEDAMRAGADPAAVGRRLGWADRGWPDFEMYRPLFDLARGYGLPVVATDLDHQTLRRIAKEGLGALPADERSRLASRLSPEADRERGIARDIEAAHCGLLPSRVVPGMVDAWHARNVTMARRILQALERAPQVVVIVGRGHQAPGGLADQVDALRPGTRQLIVDLVETGAEETSRAAPDIYTDGHIAWRIVWPRLPVERPDPCAPLRNR
jgi:uncharacterized iron-regulated protein